MCEVMIALVPASMQRSQIKGAVFRTLGNPPIIEQLLYWSPANANPCLAGFLALAEKQDVAAGSEKSVDTAKQIRNLRHRFAGQDRSSREAKKAGGS